MSFSLLIEAAARSLVLGAFVWAVLQLARVASPVARRVVWLIVLCGAFLMPLLCYWSPLQFSTKTALPPISRLVATETSMAVNARVPAPASRLAELAKVLPATQPKRSPLTYLTYAYFAVAIILLLRTLLGLSLALRLLRRSAPVCLAKHGRCTVRLSTQIATPVNIGSTIVLPVSAMSWSEEKLRVVLAHEACHVRGGDFYWQLAARLHTCLFWFSPLPWWLERELSDIAEAASDSAGRDRAASCASYAEMLLEFAARPHRVMAAVPMARRSNIRRRIERILADRQPLSSVRVKRQIACAACLVPAAILAASASLRVNAAESAMLQNPPAAAPTAPPTPSAPAPPPAPPHSPGSQRSSSSYSYSTGQTPYVVVSGDGVTMSGSGNNLSAARHQSNFEKGDYIWFVRSGKSYVIDDPELVRQSKEFFKPQEDLGRQQALLGEQEAKLGEEQAKLGELQSKVLVDPPKIDTEALAKLLAQVKQIEGAARKVDQEQLSKLQTELADLQARLGDAQALAGEEQGKLGEKQGKLGELQGALGEKQGKLGEEQGRLAEQATRKMQSLLDNALRSGKARQVH